MRIKVGSYKGDGAATQEIRGIGFTPLVVIVKNISTSTVHAHIKIGTMVGNDSKRFAGTGYVADAIHSLETDGFTVGSGTGGNTNGDTYIYFAAYIAGDGDMNAGGYTGNDSDDRFIGTPSFDPDFVILCGNDTGNPIFRHASDSVDISHSFVAGVGDQANAIQDFPSGGFEVGNIAANGMIVNQDTNTYDHFSMLTDTGVFKMGTYTGDGAASQPVTGVGFQPDIVIVKNDTTSTNHAVFTTSQSGVDNSHNFGGVANVAGRITSLDPDGFTVGNNVEVNTNLETYMYMAWKMPTELEGKTVSIPNTSFRNKPEVVGY